MKKVIFTAIIISLCGASEMSFAQSTTVYKDKNGKVTKTVRPKRTKYKDRKRKKATYGSTRIYTDVGGRKILTNVNGQNIPTRTKYKVVNRRVIATEVSGYTRQPSDYLPTRTYTSNNGYRETTHINGVKVRPKTIVNGVNFPRRKIRTPIDRSFNPNDITVYTNNRVYSNNYRFPQARYNAPGPTRCPANQTGCTMENYEQKMRSAWRNGANTVANNQGTSRRNQAKRARGLYEAIKYCINCGFDAVKDGMDQMSPYKD